MGLVEVVCLASITINVLLVAINVKLTTEGLKNLLQVKLKEQEKGDRRDGDIR